MNANMKGMILLLSIFVLTLISSCTDENNPNSDMLQGDKLIEALKMGTKQSSYVVSDYNIYMNDGISDKWEEISKDDISQIAHLLPAKLNIYDGKVWMPYNFNDDSNSIKLYFSWLSYCNYTGFDKILFTRTFLDFDNKDKLKIIDKECVIEECNSSDFTLSYISSYLYGKSDTYTHGVTYVKGFQKDVVKYTEVELDLPSIERIVYYNSERELLLDVFNRLEETFGKEINLNEYLSPNIILDEPIVDIEYLKNNLL